MLAGSANRHEVFEIEFKGQKGEEQTATGGIGGLDGVPMETKRPWPGVLISRGSERVFLARLPLFFSISS